MITNDSQCYLDRESFVSQANFSEWVPGSNGNCRDKQFDDDLPSHHFRTIWSAVAQW